MKRKDYRKPTMMVVKVQHVLPLMASRQVQATMSQPFTETDGWDEDAPSGAKSRSKIWDND